MNIDPNKYKIKTWKSWKMLHWILNPAIALTEMGFGQRVPKVFLEDKTSRKPKNERSYIPCPHCDTIHDHRTWSLQNDTLFRNWFGLYCPQCGQIIPCIINWLSFLLLCLSYPIWGWFKNDLKRKWLEKQPERFINLDLEKTSNPFEHKGWIKQGLTWGLLMYIFMGVLFPLMLREPITWARLLWQIPYWGIVGLAYGYFMRWLFNKQAKKAAAKKE